MSLRKTKKISSWRQLYFLTSQKKWNYCFSLMNCLIWHLWGCLQKSPWWSLMPCCFAHWEMFWPEVLCLGCSQQQSGNLGWDLGSAVETVPLLSKVSVSKRNGNGFHLGTNGSKDCAAQIIPFFFFFFENSQKSGKGWNYKKREWKE